MKKEEVVAPILQAVHTRIVEVDRPTRDWTKDIGRAVISVH